MPIIDLSRLNRIWNAIDSNDDARLEPERARVQVEHDSVMQDARKPDTAQRADVLTAVLNVMAFVSAAHTFYAVLRTQRRFSEDEIRVGREMSAVMEELKRKMSELPSE